ncbi:FecCD family ABC transporter permease [Pseudalkalibacillus salsuginis]|uniref:FecCD family ABC transporter permease n=1 Tax=Pseudalkalibacillus salsuginis TaxID=2910972 RepID=UPI001F32D6A6|nr:iron ABC transporter permease [Pseudalkalibacillus salsuginis]MCF6411760.1 iron ABC transporter permease [Pseudalkalibacillus salsuginis]
MNKYQPLRLKWFSYLVDKKAVLCIMLLAILTLALLIFSVSMGQMKIHPVDVVRTLLGMGESMNELVIKSFRLPRILLALVAGMALAVSGAILQGIIRNPLASPDIIGITGGASLAAVTFLTIFSGRGTEVTVSIQWMPFAAFIGASVLGLLVYILSWKNGVNPVRLVLIGIGLAAAMQALTNMMILFGPLYLATQAQIWITGSVNGANWNQVKTLTPWVLLFLLFVWMYARRLNIQELGEDLARGFGSVVQKDRLVLLLFSTALAGGAVAFVGGVGFVGLMAPHIARKLVGSSFGALIPASALVGALLVMGADLIARTAFAPLEVPAGVFTAALGAPYFIYLLYRSRNL